MATKVPSLAPLLPLNEALEDARQDFLAACERLASFVHIDRVKKALAIWRDAAEAWNAAVSDAMADVTTFIEDHSERWIASARGQAYADWVDALENAQVETEPQAPLQLSLDLITWPTPGLNIDNADEVLPETPDVPALDDY